MSILFSKKRKKKSLPVHAVCRNCGTPLQARYCHQCGQDLFAGAQRSVKDLVFNAIENMLVLDNKILITLKYLLFYPGKLSVEYVKGKIVSYVHPSKLFWFISILFIAVVTSQISANRDDESIENEKKEVLNETNTESNSLAGDNHPADTENDTNVTKQKKQEMKEPIIDNFKPIFSMYAPYVAFLLAPFFAFLLFIIFHKQKHLYVDHLAFALHIHSFVFLLYTILILFGKIPNMPHFYSSGWLIVFLPLLYLSIAASVFYRPKKIFSMIWKILLLNFLYFTGLIVIVIFLALAFVQFLEGKNLL